MLTSKEVKNKELISMLFKSAKVIKVEKAMKLTQKAGYISEADAKLARKIITLYHKKVIDSMLHKGTRVDLPLNLGYFMIGKNLRVVKFTKSGRFSAPISDVKTIALRILGRIDEKQVIFSKISDYYRYFVKWIKPKGCRVHHYGILLNRTLMHKLRCEEALNAAPECLTYKFSILQ